jgi:hypothetical protein
MQDLRMCILYISFNLNFFSLIAPFLQLIYFYFIVCEHSFELINTVILT